LKKAAARVRVGIVDYQMGNLHSVAKALALQGAETVVSSDKARLKSCDILLLPGVGAFGAAMAGLAKDGMDDFVRRWTLEEKRPFLGFCLGLQVLFESSEESPGVPGLGVLKGTVRRFRESDFSGADYRVPHMGWNNLDVAAAGKNYFKGLGPKDFVYFVHTFFPEPADASVVAATSTYGRTFCAAAATGRLFATQFHPEKSGVVGQRIIASALQALAPEAAAC
jgi:imidazole glycerol-phosphate synthase subunit HisH